MKRRECNLILKLDMEKACVRVDWTLLKDMIRVFGFGNWFIDLVYWSLSNNWFCILKNGERAEYLKSFMELDKEICCPHSFSSLW